MYRQSEKNLLSSNISSTCPHNMVNFGLRAAEIVSGVWGTPVTFNGFRVLAALLRGSQVVSVSQTLLVEQRVPPMFSRATIRLGIGPHSSSLSELSLHNAVLRNTPQTVARRRISYRKSPKTVCTKPLDVTTRCCHFCLE